MPLSGSLSDFDIANIFMLIEQDGKTGKLIVSTKDDRKVVIFKNGQIINTYNETEDIKEFVFRYLKYVKGISPLEIQELNSIYYRNIKLLSDELVSKGYLTIQELTTIVQTAIIDITCDVIGSKLGEYIFDQHPTMDSYQFQTVALPGNFIMLEAARRSDEYGAIPDTLTDAAVFTPNTSPDIEVPPRVPPIENFGEFALSLVNGVRSVKEISLLTFFSKFHVYHSFAGAIQNQRLRSIAQPDINAIRDEQDRSSKHGVNSSHIAFTAIITVALIILILVVGRFVVYDILLSEKDSTAKYLSTQIEREQAVEKVEAAQVLFHQKNHREVLIPRELVDSGYVSKRELRYYLEE